MLFEEFGVLCRVRAAQKERWRVRMRDGAPPIVSERRTRPFQTESRLSARPPRGMPLSPLSQSFATTAQQNIPQPAAMASANATLLVVLRGEIFRIGEQHSRSTTTDATAQWRACKRRTTCSSQHCKVGWHLSCGDVWARVKKSQLRTFEERVKQELGTRLIRAATRSHAARQWRALQWVRDDVAGQWDARCYHVHVELKQPLALPLPQRPYCHIIVPFETLDGLGVADTIHFVPRSLQCAAKELGGTASRGLPTASMTISI